MDAEPAPNPRVVRDREAIGHLLGHPLTQEWPATAFAAGTRVRVVQDPNWDGPWPVEFLGVIDTVGAPEPVEHPLAGPGEFKYWVAFDEPQLDSSGEGPYRGAQIWGRYLQPM